MTLIASTSWGDDAVETSPAIDTTGATLLVIIASSYASFGPSAVLTDSEGNTWLNTNAYGTGNSETIRVWYVQNPVADPAHTFTFDTSQAYWGAAVLAFDDVFDETAFDQVNGSGSSSNDTSEQPGSVTPSEDGALIITGVGLNGAHADLAITESMTIAEDLLWVTGDNMGLGAAYKYQATAAAINPQWSWTNTVVNAAIIVTFKANYSAGGGATPAALFFNGYIGQGLGLL